MALYACPRCRRHIFASEAACPFCGALRDGGAVTVALALAAGMALAGCRSAGQADIYGGPPPPEPEIEPAASATASATAAASATPPDPGSTGEVYGAPPPPDQQR